MFGRLSQLEGNLLACLALCALVILFMAAVIEQKEDQIDLCHELAPAVVAILDQHERVRRDLVVLEADLLKILQAPSRATPVELVALIEASSLIRAGL